MIDKRFLLLAVVLLTIFCGASALDAQAATFTVTTTADSGAGSLREAVASANVSGSGSDTITFAIPAGDAGCTAGVCTITLTTGQLTINSAVTAGALTITNPTGASNLLISGDNASAVFFVALNGNLTLSGLTVTKGYSATVGGGILNEGILTLTNSVVSGNTAQVYGGGIYNRFGTITLTNTIVSGNNGSDDGGGIYLLGGTVTLNNSTVSGHTVNNFGGGFYNNSGALTLNNSTVSGNTAINGQGGGIVNQGTLTLTNSTVSGNFAPSGGGIFNNINREMTLTNSTVSGNTATFGAGIYNSNGTATLTSSTVSGNNSINGGSGGGIYSALGTLNLTSVTVTNNSSSFGSGVFTDSSTANLRNTIVAKNTGAPDFSGAISSTSTFNLIGDGTGMSGISNSAGGNQVGDSTNPIDPKLGSLAPNGGATQTHALLLGSPAIDQGNDTGTDQRGLARPVNLADYANATGGNAADIGAFEAQTAPVRPTAATVSISGRVSTAQRRGIRNVQISLTDSSGDIRTAQTTTFGYYHFDDVTPGETVVLSAKARRFKFNQPTIVRTTNESIADADFISEQ